MKSKDQLSFLVEDTLNRLGVKHSQENLCTAYWLVKEYMQVSGYHRRYGMRVGDAAFKELVWEALSENFWKDGLSS